MITIGERRGLTSISVNPAYAAEQGAGVRRMPEARRERLRRFPVGETGGIESGAPRTSGIRSGASPRDQGWTTDTANVVAAVNVPGSKTDTQYVPGFSFAVTCGAAPAVVD